MRRAVLVRPLHFARARAKGLPGLVVSLFIVCPGSWLAWTLRTFRLGAVVSPVLGKHLLSSRHLVYIVSIVVFCLVVCPNELLVCSVPVVVARVSLLLLFNMHNLVDLGIVLFGLTPTMLILTLRKWVWRCSVTMPLLLLQAFSNAGQIEIIARPTTAVLFADWRRLVGGEKLHRPWCS